MLWISVRNSKARFNLNKCLPEVFFVPVGNNWQKNLPSIDGVVFDLMTCASLHCLSRRNPSSVRSQSWYSLKAANVIHRLMRNKDKQP